MVDFAGKIPVAGPVELDMKTRIWAQAFNRICFSVSPPLEESVVVFLETELDPRKEGQFCEFDGAMVVALWAQYPSWKCPYGAGSPAPDAFEKMRHGFSSPLSVGGARDVTSAARRS